FMMPDFCAGIESPDGGSSGQKYLDWCGRYLDESMLNRWERYGIRCALFHQGQTEPHEPKKTKAHPDPPPHRYDSFVYGPRGAPHLRLEGRKLILDVSQLHAEMRAAIGRWFDDVSKAPAGHIDTNLGRMARAE